MVTETTLTAFNQSVHTGLTQRLEELTTKANSYNRQADLSKVASLASFVVAATGGPVLAPFALIGLLGYGGVVAFDWIQTGACLPFPFLRKPIESAESASDPFIRTSYGLDPHERIEYQLLALHLREIAYFLERHPAHHREYLYKQIINEAIAHGRLPQHIQEVRAVLEHQPALTDVPNSPVKPEPKEEPWRPLSVEPAVTVAYEVVNEPEPEPIPDGVFLNNLIEYPSLIFGGMGAGKSWTARHVVQLKVKAGHKVVVLDPHAANHEWLGVTHVGAGMDYGAIAKFLDWYLDEITRRYQAFNRSGLSEESWQAKMRSEGQVISVLCEEMTNWADRVPGGMSSQFFKCAMTDSRKVLMPPLLVSHNRTLTCLGNTNGMAALRDAALLELELIPTIDANMKPVSSGRGRLKLPGHQQWFDVLLPKVERKVTDFRDTSNLVRNPVNADCQGYNQPINQSNQNSDQVYGRGDRGLTREQILTLLRNGVSRSKVVKDHLGFHGPYYQAGMSLLNQLGV